MSNNIKFYKLLEVHLDNVLQKTLKSSEHKELNPLLMREIRNNLRSSIEQVFNKSKYKISTEAITWLTDQYFKRIKINDSQVMSDQVVINEYKLSELTQTDIQILRDLFVEVDFGQSLEDELKTRKS